MTHACKDCMTKVSEAIGEVLIDPRAEMVGISRAAAEICVVALEKCINEGTLPKHDEVKS